VPDSCVGWRVYAWTITDARAGDDHLADDRDVHSLVSSMRDPP
jgi:hypothetical protein